MNQKVVLKQLDRIQRLVCLYIKGAVRTTPTVALEIVVGLTPLPLYIKQEAPLVLPFKGQFTIWTRSNVGHSTVQLHLKRYSTLPLSE